MANAARSQRQFRFALLGQPPFLAIDRELGLDFLDWLGLGRPEFGAVSASELGPRCRRRLWPEPRNHAPFVHEVRPGATRSRDAAALVRLAARVVETLQNDDPSLVQFG